MTVKECDLTAQVERELLEMSADWAAENSTYGYYANGRSELEGNRIFLAREGGEVLGYLLGHGEQAQKQSSIMEAGTAFFEVEELYVRPEYRGQGVGKALFSFAQERAKAEGMKLLMLSTATKAYKRILHL